MHHATREDISREIMYRQIKDSLVTTSLMNLRMTMQCFVGDSECKNMYSFELWGTCQALTTISPNELMQPIKKVYLRAPTQDDLQRILHVSEMRGFPGMIETWEGQYTRGDTGTTTVILEAVASHDLWIWHAFFGCPGTLNDINVLDRSPVFDDVEQGTAPRVNFFVNQRPYNMAYYLADGIYPPYPTFVKSIRLPQSEPDKLFAKYQEGCRKDIERAFGVLQARFKIIREPARMWDICDLAIIMRACIILHNMIVEDERDTYAQNWTDYEQSETSGSSTTQPFSTEVLPSFANHVRARSELRDSNVHHQLQVDLVKHIWAKFGMCG
ncbi:hypothetical protein QQ045_015089 [Rhodiola kirilowii]